MNTCNQVVHVDVKWYIILDCCCVPGRRGPFVGDVEYYYHEDDEVDGEDDEVGVEDECKSVK